MKVQVYIGEDKLDLFDDEKISITQKLNDTEKLSNVFTDFTNSFTVPATPNNNRIFKHYYDVDVAGNFNANLRINGFIEIDTLPFKFGQFQLEGVVVKQHRPDNYKITFYSKTVQLSKLFGDDTIDQLDYVIVDGVRTKPFNSLSQFDYGYNQTNTLDSLNNPTFKGGNVITPLIAYTDRYWQYGTNNDKDISSSSYPILDSELRPAIKVIQIIKAIEVRYDITFKGDLFNETFFNQLFLWMNQRTDNVASIQYNDVVLSSPLVPVAPYTDDGTFTLVDNVLSSSSTTPDWISIEYKIIPTDLTLPYDAKLVYENGNTVVSNSQFSFTNQTGINYLYFNNFYTRFDPGVITNRIKAQISPKFTNTFNVEVKCIRRNAPTGPTIYTWVTSFPNVNTFNADVKVEDSLPKMKVIDFLQGIMKMFKVVIRPITTNTFYLDTLDNFYSFNNSLIKANLLDITKYVDTTDVNIERLSIYRNIQFLYQKTENVLGKRFREVINDPVNKIIGYGDLRSSYPEIAEDNDLKVELPFENMLFQRLTIQQPNANAGDGTNICIGESYSLNQDLISVSKNNSKPILFFNNGTIGISVTPLKFKFNTSTSIQTLNTIYNIGNTDNQVFEDVTQTINWGEEEDPWHLQYATQSLYRNFWSNWITTIYSIKQRKFKFEGYLPPRYIQELSLNDRLIIGQNRYKINDYTIDLVTGKTIFNLFNDI